MFKHSIKWTKKNYGHGRSGPSTYLQLHLPHSFPSPRHSAVILSTKALVGPLSFTWLLDFFQALGLIFCVWDCLLKVWPVIWLKLNDIQEISGERERERGRHSKGSQRSLACETDRKSQERDECEELWAVQPGWIAHHWVIYFCFSSHTRDPGATFSHWAKGGRLLLEKGVEGE